MKAMTRPKQKLEVHFKQRITFLEKDAFQLYGIALRNKKQMESGKSFEIIVVQNFWRRQSKGYHP